MTPSSFQIKPFNLRAASEHDYRALNVFENRMLTERLPDDPPIPSEQTAQGWQNFPEFVDLFQWAAWNPAGATLVARGVAFVRRTEDNQHQLYFNIEVLPELRRQGLGRRLLAFIVGVAQRENRRLLMATTNDRIPEGATFLQGLGATRGLETHTSQLVLAQIDHDLLRQWQAHAAERAATFEIAFWPGAFPEEQIEQAARLISAGASQQPRDQLAIEDYHFTAEHLRQVVQGALAAGSEHWAMAVRERATGRWVGLTDVFWQQRRPQIIETGMTVVLPEYRNRGLGRWLTAAMLEKVRHDCPQGQFVRVDHADSNAAIRKITQALGFKPYLAECIWQVETERAAAYLNGR